MKDVESKTQNICDIYMYIYKEKKSLKALPPCNARIHLLLLLLLVLHFSCSSSRQHLCPTHMIYDGWVIRRRTRKVILPRHEKSQTLFLWP